MCPNRASKIPHNEKPWRYNDIATEQKENPKSSLWCLLPDTFSGHKLMQANVFTLECCAQHRARHWDSKVNEPGSVRSASGQILDSSYNIFTLQFALYLLHCLTQEHKPSKHLKVLLISLRGPEEREAGGQILKYSECWSALVNNSYLTHIPSNRIILFKMLISTDNAVPGK